MSGTFCFYSEPVEVVSDGNRSVTVGLGEVGGLELAALIVGQVPDLQDVLLTLPELRHLTEVLLGCDPEVAERSRGYYLYRVQIIGMPEGATYESGHFDPDWVPDGWDPDDEWVERFGSRRFFWPSTKFEYKSKSSAQARARLIESYGATAKVVRSSLITWPSETVDEVW